MAFQFSLFPVNFYIQTYKKKHETGTRVLDYLLLLSEDICHCSKIPLGEKVGKNSQV